MLSDRAATPSLLATEVLQQVAIAYCTQTRDRPTPETIVDALLQVEKAAKQQRLTFPFTALLGTWQLAFTTGTRKLKQRGGIALGRGFYLPRWSSASIQFQPSAETAIAPFTDAGHITNQAQLGGLRVKFTGPAKYARPKKLLAFNFTQIQVQLWGANLYQSRLNPNQFRPRRSGLAQDQADSSPCFEHQAIAQLPFFAFFWVSEGAIAARGRGGGLALWVRVDDANANLQPTPSTSLGGQ
jgi:hypothetical protein